MWLLQILPDLLSGTKFRKLEAQDAIAQLSSQWARISCCITVTFFLPAHNTAIVYITINVTVVLHFSGICNNHGWKSDVFFFTLVHLICRVGVALPNGIECISS